jgi:hypothetical protein
MVKNEWSSVQNESTPIESWQKKIRHLRQFLRGWARNISGEYKKEKERLLNIIDSLDIKAETFPLSEPERSLKRASDERLAKLRRDEETKWAQRAKVKHIQEGGEILNISISLPMASIERKKSSNLSKMRVRSLVLKTLKYSLANTTRDCLGRLLKIISAFMRIGSRISPNYPSKKRMHSLQTSPNQR